MDIPQTFYDRVEYLFPYPIASCLSKFRETEKGIEKINAFIKLFDIIIKYCTIIALCNYFSDRKNDEACDSPVLNFLKDGKSDSTGWLEILKLILKNYLSRRDEFFVPELCSFIFDSDDKLTENIERLEEGINISGKILDKQGGLYVEKLEVLVIELLEELSFLQNYPLIKPIIVTPQGENFSLNAYRCMGSDTNFKYDRITCKSPFTLQKLQLLNPQKKELLELHPFLFPCICKECQRTHIFIFDYIYSDKVNYIYPVENHRLPCTSVKKDLEQIVSRSVPLRKQIYYEDLWIESRAYREKNLAEKYKLLELVGSGGMGDVYKALQINLGTIRAIKILPQNLCGNLKYIKRFEREARLAARLEHENIVRVIDVGETVMERYIVMEYIEGKTLRDVLNDRESLPEEEIIYLAKAIASGLSWIHQNDIIHRDIKPENIMIDINGKVKIADFGISKSTGSPRVTAVGAPIGTAQYLSPEQASGHGEVGFYSDIYSLGIVLYEMMTGRFPYEFKDDNPFSIAYTIINTDVTPIKETAPGISSNLEALVMKCLEKDPKRRYPDAQEILKNLKTISEKNNGTEEASSPFLEGLSWSGKSTQEVGPIVERHTFEAKDAQEIKEKDRANSDSEIKYSNLLGSVLSKGYMTDEEKQIIKSAREKLNISSEQNIRIFSEVKDKYKEKIDRVRTQREDTEETLEQKVKACIKKGNEYYDRKNYNSAVKEYKAALELSDTPDIHNSIGAAYCLLGRYDRAIIEFEASLKLDRNNSLAIRNLNHIYGLKKSNITRKMYGENNEGGKSDIHIDEEKLKTASERYRQFLDRLWSKTYVTDKEQKEIDLMKKKLHLPEDISLNIEREVERENEDRLKARETYRMDVMDMAITSYTTLLENLWNKGYLTEEDKKYMQMQKEEYNLPGDISEQIEKDVEATVKAKDKERIEKAIKEYKELLNDYWNKGFLSQKEKETLEKYRIQNRLPDEKILSIEKDIKNRYYKNKIELAINKEGPARADSDNWPVEDYRKPSYPSFVSREKELEELLSYAMSSDKMEQDMAFWALLNTFETLIKELNMDKRDWATPSFVKSLRKAKHIIPKEKARLISLIDNIFKGLTRSTRRFGVSNKS